MNCIVLRRYRECITKGGSHVVLVLAYLTRYFEMNDEDAEGDDDDDGYMRGGEWVNNSATSTKYPLYLAIGVNEVKVKL